MQILPQQVTRTVRSDGPKAAWDHVSQSVFEIGGEDQIAGLRKLFVGAPTEEAEIERLDGKWKEFVKQAGIRVGTLLKWDNISFLIAIGASKDTGGVLLSKVPKET